MLPVNIREKKIPSCFGVGSGREVTILKCTESVLRNKGLPSEGGCFTRATWELREGKCGQLQLHLAFLSVGRQEKKKKSLRNASEGHRPGTQAP